MQTEFTLPQTLEGLRHMDTVIESRVGVNRIFQGIDEGQLNDHDRIGQLSTMAAQRVEQIARIFSNGVAYLFSLAHELVIKSGHQNEAVKLRGEWIPVDPTQWRTGRDMRVVAPFAAGNKDTLVARLLTISQLQEKALTAGLPIVTPDDAYNTAIELTKASDFPAADKFWTNPQDIPPPPEEPDYTMMALEVENKKADNQAKDSELDAQVKSETAQLDAEIDKYRADLTAETQLILAQIKAGQSVDLEKVKADLKVNPIQVGGENVSVSKAFEAGQRANEQMAQALEGMMDKLGDAIENMAAEKEVIRDKSGRVTGTRRKSNGAG
jgi:hypothetical protein